jgi:uncharacterized membrane protein
MLSQWCAVRRKVAAIIYRFQNDRHANIAIMSAIFFPVTMVLAAFAVDEGTLYIEKRDAQNITDIAAIAAAANLENAENAALAALQDNGYANISAGSDWQYPDEIVPPGAEAAIKVELGNYVADPGLAPEERFVVGAAPVNAAKVTMRYPGTLYFSAGFLDTPMIETQAVATSSAQAAFSIGSRLASLDSGILNEITNDLLGTNLSLQIMDYEALVDAQINLLQFFDALASELDITAGTYRDVLDADVSLGQIVEVFAGLLAGQPAAQAAISKYDSGSASNLIIPLDHVIDLGRFTHLAIGQDPAAIDAQMGIMAFLGASAVAANGENQIALDLGFAVPGLIDLTADLAIGEPLQQTPWFSIGEGGDIVRTAQTRLFVLAKVGGKGLLNSLKVHLPIYLEIAYAQARMANVSCPGGRINNATVEIDARPGIADLWIADVNKDTMNQFATNPHTSQAKLVNSALINISGLAHVEIGNLEYSGLMFDYDDIISGSFKNVSTFNYSQSLVNSLLGDLQLEIDIGGLNLILPSAIRAALAATLTPVTASLDSVLYSILSSLGIRIGEADIRVNGIKCQRPVLVN